MTNGARNMTFSNAWWPKDQYRGPLVDPGASTSQRHNVGLGEHGYLGKLEACQRLGHIQLGLPSVTLESALGPLGQFVLQQAAQETPSRPPLFVRTLSKLLPQPAHRG